MSLRRNLLLGIILYGLILIGLATLNPALIAAALPLVLYLGAVVLFWPPPLQLRITRKLSADYVPPGRSVTVELTVANEGGDLDEVTVHEQVPAGLKVTGDTSAIIGLASGKEFTLIYEVEGSRGAYRFSGPSIAAQEHLGLFRRHIRYSVSNKLSVLPALPKVRSIPIRPLRTRGFAGPIPSRHAGPGTDFYGVRNYEPGDPWRWINWRLSARHPRDLFTNQFEWERIADVGLILDARERTDVTVNGVALFEHAVEAAASLADSFIGEGNHVGLLIYGRGLERTFPGYGKHQHQRIMRALSQAKIGDSLVFDSLDYLPTRFFPAKSQIVLISPLCEDDPPVLSRLRSRGYEIIVVSPDPVTYEAQALEPGVARALAERIARAERALWIHQLQRIGVQVVDWQVDKPLDIAIHAALSGAVYRRRRL